MKRAAVLLATLLVSFGDVSASWGSPPSKLECIRDNEDGQDKRKSGHFGEAVALFQACSIASCPASIRKDCASRLQEARDAFPTIAVTVQDANGVTIPNTRIEIDDAKRDGSAIEVEPGDHTLRVAADGYRSARKQLAVRDGEKITETIVLRPDREPVADAEGRTKTPATNEEAVSQRTLAFVVGGVGVAGIAVGGIMGVIAKNKYDSAVDDCDHRPSACTNPSAIDSGNGAHSLLTASTVTMFIGAAFLAGAAVLFVTTRRGHDVRAQFEPTSFLLNGTWP